MYEQSNEKKIVITTLTQKRIIGIFTNGCTITVGNILDSLEKDLGYRYNDNYSGYSELGIKIGDEEHYHRDTDLTKILNLTVNFVSLCRRLKGGTLYEPLPSSDRICLYVREEPLSKDVNTTSHVITISRHAKISQLRYLFNSYLQDRTCAKRILLQSKDKDTKDIIIDGDENKKLIDYDIKNNDSIKFISWLRLGSNKELCKNGELTNGVTFNIK